MLFLTTFLAYGISLQDGDEKTDEEADGPYSDDEMLTRKGLRRSQSMKSVKTIKGRKEVSQVESCLAKRLIFRDFPDALSCRVMIHK